MGLHDNYLCTAETIAESGNAQANLIMWRSLFSPKPRPYCASNCLPAAETQRQSDTVPSTPRMKNLDMGILRNSRFWNCRHTAAIIAAEMRRIGTWLMRENLLTGVPTMLFAANRRIFSRNFATITNIQLSRQRRDSVSTAQIKCIMH
jgi:hypothetical protein